MQYNTFNYDVAFSNRASLRDLCCILVRLSGLDVLNAAENISRKKSQILLAALRHSTNAINSDDAVAAVHSCSVGLNVLIVVL